MSGTKPDDLAAVRTIVDTLNDFSPDEQQRILRWTIEKLGLSIAAPATYPAGTIFAAPSAATSAAPPAPAGGTMDIKRFIEVKKPRNDVQYAAAVAYYYRFEAPPAEKKDAITGEDLQTSTRLSGRGRFTHPIQTLNNAHTLGLLDRGQERGTFVINTVGENLVAMTLPDGTPSKKAAKKKPPKNRR
jgi:hypothetical protein